MEFAITIIHEASLKVENSAERKYSALKPIVTYVGMIRDIQDCINLLLVQDSLEVVSILDYLGYPATDEDGPLVFSGLIVSIRDRVYAVKFVFEGSFPFLYKAV